MKTWIKVEFIMEMILHTDMVPWLAQEHRFFQSKDFKFGDWEQKRIQNNKKFIGNKDMLKS